MSERKTEQAKSLLVRFIREHQMQPGDQLPPQDHFRQQFRFGTATIGAAIRELKQDGVLEVRDKVGVFVIDPNADGHFGRVIGLTAFSRDISSYYGSLLCLLQMELVKYGCRAEIFCCEHPGGNHEFKVTDFPGLRRFIERGELDGLVHLDDFVPEALRYFREKKLPTVFVGNVSSSDNAVFIDEYTVLRRGIEDVLGYGCRLPVLVLSKWLAEIGKDNIRGIAAEYGIPASRILYCGSADDGRRLAGSMLALPPERRPDAIVSIEDVVAGALTAELAMNLTAEEMPAAVILTNHNSNFSFPVKRLSIYRNDLAELARLAVELLVGNITGKIDEPRQVWYLPRKI